MVRMLIYIVLICSAFITSCIYYYSVQASSKTQLAMGEQLQQLHDQTLVRIQKSFEELDHTLRLISNDYAIQRLSEGTVITDSAEDRALREYADYLLRSQRSQFPFVTNICMSLDVLSYTLCTESLASVPPIDTTIPTLRKYDRSILTREKKDGGAGGYEVLYTAPLMNRKNVIKGSIQFTLMLDPLMKDIYSKMPLLRNQLVDSNGVIMYSTQTTTGNEWIQKEEGSKATTETLQWGKVSVVSTKKLELPGTVWFSQLETKQFLENSFAEAFQSTLGLFIVWLLLLCILCMLVFQHYSARPMKHLRGLMNRAELGDFKAYWVHKSSRDWNELGESYNQMLNRLEELIRQVKREESLKKEAEMEALQYQLNPHFLYNTLNTIKWVAKMHQTPQIAEVVTSLVRLLQASLGKKGDFITVREEIELIHDYIDIQAFRYGDKIRMEYQIDSISEGCLVPRMILQPLLENAIIHGIEPSRQVGIIRIAIWIEAERDLLICQVEDNGIGMMEDKALESTSGGGMRERMSGIGLRHIREKIKLYYGSGYSMNIVSKLGHGTTIRLTLPVHQNEEG
ncbi:Histidine kinase-, DNA gyrase B-, and HSP90-like ATPase [Paenibacillus sp. 1_12]|uniref:sensor histidine kinase n=1 Tax=Paenibacillus sp. 1_12 TaxID=1566278 RepID=UPI0008E858C4|nr:histidine kinase [Paenibacillus sp. 1_12]SFL83165.1 Histidine kinase-, DNA gyrase B-, and HSP90-like ATPase [Paenibacillus sp. 1_12]